MEKTLNGAPPRRDFEILVVHKMRELYAFVYLLGNKLPKRDKLGLHSYIEKEFLQTFSFLIGASLEPRLEKIILLKKARLQVEILKQLIRTEYELKIISEKTYLVIELKLQEISKMTNGWLKYEKNTNSDQVIGVK